MVGASRFTRLTPTLGAHCRVSTILWPYSIRKTGMSGIPESSFVGKSGLLKKG
jgi:hypothetical protein